MTNYVSSCVANFRYDTFRPHQKEALEAIAGHLDNGVKFIVAELPTGVGKSDIAMSLALSSPDIVEHKRIVTVEPDEYDLNYDPSNPKTKEVIIYNGGAYVATSQNTLIDQYKKDFGSMKDFFSIKGRRNYECVEGKEELDDGTIVYKTCEEMKFDCASCKEGGCTYSKNKGQARSSKACMTNLTYYGLAMPYADQWPKRELTVFDEAHNLPSEILSLVSMTVSNYTLGRMMLGKMVTDAAFPDKIVDSNDFYEFILRVSVFAEAKLKSLMSSVDNRGYAAEIEKTAIDECKSFIWKADKFMTSFGHGEKWVVDKEDNKFGTRLIARPLHSGYFAKNIFFKQSSQYLLQSATIIDCKTYAKELGISGQGIFVKKPSPFNLVEKRPFYLMNTAYITRKSMDDSLPKVLKQINEIMDKYKGKKGMVHTHSYAIHKYLQENMKGNKRCIFAEVGKRQEAVDSHLYSGSDSVLFSPSMTEGFDGKGDLLRFQIIIKVPYPDLSDRRTVLRKEEDVNWYYYQTMKVIMQAAGRGMRSEDDYCDTFMLDSCVNGFLSGYNPDREFANTIKSSTLARKYLDSLV